MGQAKYLIINTQLLTPRRTSQNIYNIAFTHPLRGDPESERVGSGLVGMAGVGWYVGIATCEHSNMWAWQHVGRGYASERQLHWCGAYHSLHTSTADEEEVAALKDITKEDVLTFFKASVVVVGNQARSLYMQ